MPEVITNNLGLWTSALLTKSTAGRGSNGKLEAYGIKKLRELILDLAMRGKLLEQNQNDEPAANILRKTKHWPLKMAEDSGQIPHGWVSAPLEALSADTKYPIGDGDHGQIKPACYTDSGIPYIRVADLGWGNFEPNGLVHIPEAVHEQNLKSELRPGDILIAKTGATIGKCCIIPDSIPRANTTSSVGKVTVNQEIVLSKWIICYFLSGGFKEKMWAVSKKTAQPGFNIVDLKRFVVPVPPLAEQHRIVAKVDELMALCDLLEQQQTHSIKAHQALVASLLGPLTRVGSQQEFSAAWARIASHFDILFTTEASIDQLKQTILQLAVMGRLNESISGGWEIQRLDKVCSEIVDCPHSTPKWTATGKICVRTSQFKPGKLDLSGSRFVSESTFAERVSRLKPEADDILYSREGGILGVACRVPPEVELCLGQRMMLMRPGGRIVSAFLELVLNSPVITGIAQHNTTGGAAPRVNVSTVKSYPIPVPSLDEQHRIVAKVDELMALCDTLKARLADAQAIQLHLADAIVEQAVC